MPHISKTPLPDKELANLFDQFNHLIARLDQSQSAAFFSELLGPEEQIQLTKRLAAVVMFIEGNSSYRVAQLLQLSPSTAERIRRDFMAGRYDASTQFLTQSKTEYEEFWRVLDVILRAGLPPRGRGRWKSVFSRP